MPYVLVNPQTRKPTGFIFPDDLAPILEGQYQNAAMVTEDEQRQLLKEAVALHPAFPYVMRERERCAKIAEAHSGCPVGGCDGRDCGEDIADKIRSGE